MHTDALTLPSWCPSPAVLTTRLTGALERSGVPMASPLSADAVQVVRVGTRVAVALPAAGLFAILVPSSLARRLADEHTWASRLDTLMDPAAALVAFPHAAAVLYRLHPSVSPPTPSLLGRHLTAFHAETPRHAPRRPYLAERITPALVAARTAGLLTAAEHTRLTRHLDDAVLAATVAPGPLGWGLTHGDAHLANLLTGTADSRPVLCDLELLGAGPRALDLVPLLVEHRRYGAPRTGFDALVEAYASASASSSVRSWTPEDDPSLEPAIALHELWLAAWALETAVRLDGTADGAHLASEARLRVDGVLGSSSALWTRY